MRRDYFTLDVTNVDWVEHEGEPAKPTVEISFDGPGEELRERLTGTGEKLLTAAETDAAFRLTGPVDDPDTTGVVSVTNRVTGDFVLELNQEAADVLQFISAARRFGQANNDADGSYLVHIDVNGDRLVSYDKQTFLVYDQEGSLLRQHSLIPSGVEL